MEAYLTNGYAVAFAAMVIIGVFILCYGGIMEIKESKKEKILTN